MNWLTRRLFPLLAIVLACPQLRAEDKVQEVIGARGSSIQAAVTNGLVRALEQVKGFRIESSIGVRKKHNAETLEIRNGMDEWFARYDSGDVSTGQVERHTHGLIRTYAITKQEQDERTRDWIVDLKVTVPVYDAQNPREGAMRTIAFAGFQSSASSYELGRAKIAASELNRQLVDQCTALFTKSPKFEVLTRGDFLKELDREYDLIGGAKMAFDEQIKLGNRMGADYLVVGRLEELSFEEVPFEVKTTGYRGVKAQARYGLGLQILDVATSKVVWAGDARGSFDDAELKQLPTKYEDMLVSDFLIEEMTWNLSAQIQDQLFPLQVIQTSGGRVLINADPSRTATGDTYEVWLVGEPIMFEGEMLGLDERKVGSIRVSDLRDRFAYCELIQGELEEMQPKAICRRPRD